MMIICIEATETGLHYFETQSHRTKCWLEGYIAVPQELESIVVECGGYCDLVIRNNIVKEVIARPDLIPIQEAEQAPTEFEQLRADVDYIAIMTGVDL